MKKLGVIMCIAMVLALSSFIKLETHKFKVRTIVIDAGHGGKDGGCLGKKSMEKEVTLSIALKLGKLLKSSINDVRIIYTRSEDKFIELHDRAGIANKNNADLFISLHCNSGPNEANGTETYSMGLHVTDENLAVAKRENSVILKEDNYLENYGGFDPNSAEAYILFSLYQNAYLKQSLSLATNIEGKFKKREGRKSRGVKQAGFLVLWRTSMPSVLVEMGFLTNHEEESYLNNDTNRDSVAKDLFYAINEYKDKLEEEN